MQALTAGSSRARPTSLHVFLALVIMVVTLALVIGLAGQPRADRDPMADEDSAFDANLAGAPSLVESRDGAADALMEAPLAAPPAEASVAGVQASVDMPMVTAEAESRVDDAHIVRTASLELEVQDVADFAAGRTRCHHRTGRLRLRVGRLRPGREPLGHGDVPRARRALR